MKILLVGAREEQHAAIEVREVELISVPDAVTWNGGVYLYQGINSDPPEVRKYRQAFALHVNGGYPRYVGADRRLS